MAETINGPYKTEVNRHRGSWRIREAVEFATLEWVEWFNRRRLLEPIGNIPPTNGQSNNVGWVRARRYGDEAPSLKRTSVRFGFKWPHLPALSGCQWHPPAASGNIVPARGQATAA